MLEKKTETAKRIKGNSPDEADAFFLTFAHLVPGLPKKPRVTSKGPLMRDTRNIV